MKQFRILPLSGVLTFSLVVAAGNCAYAAAGDLDPSFGAAGQAETNFGRVVIPSAALLQPDGNIVVAAGFNATPIAAEAMALVRYLADGSLDPSFGNGGVSEFAAFTDFVNIPNALALQSDAKILVAGETRNAMGGIDEFVLARFNPDGIVDNSFGNAGVVATSFGPIRSSADAILLQPDGQILVSGVLVLGGARTPLRTVLARYNPDGSLDTSFGDGGRVVVIAIGDANQVALDSDGRILAINAVIVGTQRVVQFNPDGSVNSPTAVGTIIATSNGSGIQADTNFIVVGAQATIGRRGDIEVVVDRVTPNNTPNPSFNRAMFDFGAESDTADEARVVAIQSNGQIIVGGDSNSGSTRFGSTFGLARLNTDGSLDDSFGNAGTVTTEFQCADSVRAVLIQPDGNIIAVGSVRDSSGRIDIALARYLGQ